MSRKFSRGDGMGGGSERAKRVMREMVDLRDGLAALIADTGNDRAAGLRQQIEDRIDQLNFWIDRLRDAIDDGGGDDAVTQDMEDALEEWARYLRFKSARRAPGAHAVYR